MMRHTVICLFIGDALEQHQQLKQDRLPSGSFELPSAKMMVTWFTVMYHSLLAAKHVLIVSAYTSCSPTK